MEVQCFSFYSQGIIIVYYALYVIPDATFFIF